MALTLVSSNRIFGGLQKVFKHASSTLGTEATFAIYLPEAKSKVPVVYWLSGLTCTEQNFITKAGAQQFAQKYQVAIVCPDTSPRGSKVPDEDGVGSGAGFYVDATKEPWATNYKMYSYVTKELPEVIESNFSTEVNASLCSIMGHSMGGHGALVCALRNPGRFKAVSAFAPICAPSQCPWGQRAFNAYLGEDKSTWSAYDASELAKVYTGPTLNVLVDQGADDEFLSAGQLHPQKLRDAAASNEKLKLTYREHAGYNHSYYFIATFIEDHIRMHSEALNKS